MGQKFPTFNNALAPLVTDHIVGYGDVSGVDTEKRWTVSTLVTFIQSVLDITRVAGGSDNYLRVTGSATGTGEVTLKPAGTDANQDLILEALGTGEVIINGNIQINANFDTGGYDFTTSGGGMTLGAGLLNTENGDITTGSGSITLASGDLTLTTGSIIVDAGDITLSAAGTLDVAGGILKTDAIEASLGAVIAVGHDIVIGIGANTLTASGIIGNKTAPAAGNEPIDIEITGVTDLNGETFVRDKAYFDSDIMTDTYLRASQSIGLTADVGSAQGSGLIFSEFNQYATCANIGDAATLPALAAEGYSLNYRYPYMKIIVRNDGANAMDVFPNTGGTIDGGVADAAVSVAAGAQATFYGIESGGTDVWFTA